MSKCYPGIAITVEEGIVLLDTLVNPGVPIAGTMTRQHGLNDEMVASAPPFADVYLAIQTALSTRNLVVYDDADEHLLSELCHLYQLKDLHHGCHEVRDEYVYYFGQLNADPDARAVSNHVVTQRAA